VADSYRVPYLPVGSTYDSEEIDAVVRVLQSGEKLSCGPERDAFEREFGQYINSRFAISLANCTVALELATYLLQLQPGDEVIATTQTYQATLTPLLNLPVKVKFCDIDPNTLNVSVESFASLITNRTRALYLVHYGGIPADMEPIMALANRHGIKVIEDCAHALGASYHGRSPGTFGFGCWSFQSYKNISTLGEGGMLTLEGAEYADAIDRIRSIEPDADFVPIVSSPFPDHVRPEDEIERHAKNAYDVECIGLRHPGTNSTLAEPAAAAGRVQLRKLDQFVERRRKIAATLDEGLRAISGVRTQVIPPGVESGHHLYTFFLEGRSSGDRDRMLASLDRAGVQVQLRYFPVHLLPEWRYRGTKLGDCPVAEKVWFDEQVNLPIYPQMEDWQLDLMLEAVQDAITEIDR